MTSYSVDFTRDALTFLARSWEHLAAEALVANVLLTVAGREARRAEAEPGTPPPEAVRWFATVLDGSGTVVGAAMRTAPFPPRPLFVTPMPRGAATALADALIAREEHPGGVNGSLPAARIVAERCAARWGDEAVVDEHTRLHQLGQLMAPPAPPGELRVAGPEDVDLCLRWFSAFDEAAAEQAGREASHAGDHWSRDEVARRVDEGRVWLWVLPEGEPVHLTVGTTPEAGVARLGLVYTPPEHRRRGYAGRAVAEVAALLAEDGARVTLFTDQANPDSNALYTRLGFWPVVDMANHLLLPSLES